MTLSCVSSRLRMQWQVPLLMQIKYCIILLKAVKTIFQKKIYYRCLSFFQMQLWGELTSLNSRLNVVIGRNSICNYQSALFQEILAITMPQDAQIFKRSWLVKGWANDWYLSSPLRIGFFFRQNWNADILSTSSHTAIWKRSSKPALLYRFDKLT